MSYHSSPDNWQVGQTVKRRRLVHVSDGSEASFRALETAFRLAEAWGGSLRILLISDLLPQCDLAFEVNLEQRRADRRLAQIERRVESIAVHYAAPHRTYYSTGHPVRNILQFVKETNADLLVIGVMPTRNLVDLLLGRRDRRIARRATCKVLVVP